MSAPLLHLLSGITVGVDGYVSIRCDCGWDDGPFPDNHTAVDVLLAHVYGQGFRAGRASLASDPQEAK